MDEFRAVLKGAGISLGDFGDLLGLTRSSLYASLSRGSKRGAPRWVKSFMIGYKLGMMEKKKSTPRGSVQ